MRRLFLAICCLSFFTTVAHAATAPEAASAPVAAARPRIGLVLGGGGARGLAHFGVLEQLERLHIPISCIAGTSAGALVGGAYAAGVPLDEMTRKVEDADWDALLNGSPDRRGLPYARKKDDFTNLAAITLGADLSGVRVPRSVIGTQAIDRFLHDFTHDTYVSSFDELPIPFQAVATNLVSGQMKVFDGGDLATALRASMAVPGVFDLVQQGDQLYVDGMFVRNLPVANVLGKCADIVIAVDVGTPRLKADEIHSLVDVAAQAMNIATGQNVMEQRRLLRPQDVLITPDLDGYTAASFADAKQIIARGRKLPEETLARLRALSVDDASYAAWKATLATRLAKIDSRYQTLEIAGTRFVPPDEVRDMLEKPTPPSDREQLLGRIDRLYESGDFDRINYHLREENGQRVAVVTPLERSVGPDYLRFGLDIRLDTHRTAEIGLLGNYQMTWLNRWGAQWRNDIRISKDSSLNSEFYQPLGRSDFFTAAQVRLASRQLPVYNNDGNRIVDLGINETSGGLDLGYTLGRYGEFRLGPQVSRTSTRVESGLLSFLDSVRSHGNGYRSSLIVDQLDNPRFPRHGYYLRGDYRDLRVRDSSNQSSHARVRELDADWADTFGRTTLRTSFRGRGVGESAGRDSGEYFQLGGFQQLSGLQTDQLIGKRTTLARFMAYQRIAPLMPLLGSGTYLGTSLEAGRVWKQGLDGTNTRWIPAASAWLGVDTLLGPLYFGLGWADYHGSRFAGYLYLGYSK